MWGGGVLENGPKPPASTLCTFWSSPQQLGWSTGCTERSAWSEASLWGQESRYHDWDSSGPQAIHPLGLCRRIPGAGDAHTQVGIPLNGQLCLSCLLSGPAQLFAQIPPHAEVLLPGGGNRAHPTLRGSSCLLLPKALMGLVSGCSHGTFHRCNAIPNLHHPLAASFHPSSPPGHANSPPGIAAHLPPPSTAGGLSPGPKAAPDGAGVRRCERDGFITRSLLLRLLSIRSCHLPLPLMGREEASVTGAERALLRAAACCSRPRPRSRPFLPFSFPPSSLAPSLPFLLSFSLSASGFHVLLLQLPLSSRLRPSAPLTSLPLPFAQSHSSCPHLTSPFFLPSLAMFMAIPLSQLPQTLGSSSLWSPISHPIYWGRPQPLLLRSPTPPLLCCYFNTRSAGRGGLTHEKCQAGPRGCIPWDGDTGCALGAIGAGLGARL